MHSGEIIGAGLMSKIQKDIGIDREYFIKIGSDQFSLTDVVDNKGELSKKICFQHA